MEDICLTIKINVALENSFTINDELSKERKEKNNWSSISGKKQRISLHGNGKWKRDRLIESQGNGWMGSDE